MARVALAGWVLRLLIAGSLVAGVYAVYRALFVTVSQSDPGHDRLAWVVVIGISLGLSLLSFALLHVLDKSVRARWYGSAYLVVVMLELCAFFLSFTLRRVGEWQRSTVPVTATVSDCYEDALLSGITAARSHRQGMSVPIRGAWPRCSTSRSVRLPSCTRTEPPRSCGPTRSPARPMNTTRWGSWPGGSRRC
jgi:hypothetical protein